MDTIIYTREIGKYIEGEYIGRFRRRFTGIWNSRGIFGRHQERVWKKRQRDSQGNRTKKIRARRKDNGEICLRVQKDSQRK